MRYIRLLQAGWRALPTEIRVLVYGFLAACLIAGYNALQGETINLALFKDSVVEASKFYLANVLLVFVGKLNSRKDALQTRSKN